MDYEIPEDFYDVIDQQAFEECVKCKECNIPMFLIYDDSIRDTCKECGGEAKISYFNPAKEGKKKNVAK